MAAMSMLSLPRAARRSLPALRGACRMMSEDAKKVVCAGKVPSYQAVEAGKTYFWCSCGRSAKQPFCDGAHKGTEFTPVKYVAETSGKVKFCMCKSTNSQPICDASHLRVLIPFFGTSVKKGGLYYRREWEKK